MARTSVSPARHTRRDQDLQTNVRGIHGYRADCDCGWRGSVWDTWGEAAADARLHRLAEHKPPWQS